MKYLFGKRSKSFTFYNCKRFDVQFFILPVLRSCVLHIKIIQRWGRSGWKSCHWGGCFEEAKIMDTQEKYFNQHISIWLKKCLQWHFPKGKKKSKLIRIRNLSLLGRMYFSNKTQILPMFFVWVLSYSIPNILLTSS